MIIFEDLNPDFGEAFKRFSKALRENSPQEVEWSNTHENADIILLHVVGGKEFQKLQSYPLDKVVIYQHCLYTTSIPPKDWEPFWSECKGIVSWNDLYDVVPKKEKFLRLPLGADPKLFNVVPAYNKNIDIFTTGHVAETENIDVLYEACKDSGKVLHHTGHNFSYSPNWYKFHPFMNDQEFSSLLSKARFVAGLRNMEGFEMMCVEGAMTGAIPIVPSLPSYSFYKDFGILVDVEKGLKESLVSILSREYVPMTEEQIEHVRHEFSWENILSKFFKEIL